jgi:hypothetical protein
MVTHGGTRRRWIHGGAGLWLALIAACAQVEAPPGGPIDEVPPRLIAVVPDSGAVGVGGLSVLRFAFSEKMEKADAVRWLVLYPPVPVRKTSWHGLREAEVQLESPLPADTVVVIEMLAGMKDAHGLPGLQARRYPIATGGVLPGGEITGSLILEDKPLAGGVVTLRAAAADTLDWTRRPVVRRAVADTLGRYRFSWLAPGGPYLVQAMRDDNSNLRADEGEAQRLLPDTVQVTAETPSVDLGQAIVYLPTAPGRLVGRLAARPPLAGPVIAFTLKFADPDTGWSPAPQAAGGKAGTAVPDTGLASLPKAGPGLVRAIFFVDASGDSLLSAIPLAAADSSGAWVLEPWALVDSLLVPPGLEAAFPAPVWPDTLTTWPAPIAAPDSSQAAPDSSQAAPDSLLAPPDTLRSAPPDTSGGER